ELIEQHRVHGFVANTERLANIVAGHQIRIDLCHFFGHQTELGNARRIEVVFVAEGDWLEIQDRFARLAHRFYCFLETCGGSSRAEVTSAIHDNCYTCWNDCPTYPGDKRLCLYSGFTDADGFGLTRSPQSANIDVVTASRQIYTGLITHCNVI